ncbi:hypothetical protein EJ08DRAFT_489937 [Tothia fuscella]|uniref:J domain-containing protein n=1 Tax=Tothia fuscella TaxID=1048955 RepID=A0A9P4NHY8_9PEZI|nr:hypothetical protein EJ08DRAFT_489937 [Tothia fuscella]
MLPSDREYSREYPFRNLDDFQDEDLGPPPPFMDFDHLEPDFGMEYDGCGMRGGEFDMRGSGFDMRDDDFNFREDMRNFPRHPRRPRRGLNAFSSDRTWQPDTTSPIKEAKTAFQNYDKQWKNIFDNTNAQKYPYPTTTREAGPLRSPSRILVSRSRGHQAFMAEDDIMKANTMLFFLDAFNMRPYIAGGLNLRIDRHESHAKVDELKQQLQTERLRWHPDKLKWRKEGRELEDVDRAVFEGIQELWKQCNDLGRMRK